jgi:hypothetical protein
MESLSATTLDAVNTYLYRYLFLKISAILQRHPADVETAVPKVLNEIDQSGIFRYIAAYVWIDDDPPIQFPAGELRAGLQETDLLRADWVSNGISISVFADTAKAANPADELLIEFIAQQFNRLIHEERLRSLNLSLRAELESMTDTLDLWRFLNRAQSLLVARHGISPATAGQLLTDASEEHQKPILTIAREIVAVLGNPVLRTPAERRSRRHRARAAA